MMRSNSISWMREWSAAPAAAVVTLPVATATITAIVTSASNSDPRALKLKVLLLEPATLTPDTQQKQAGTELELRCWNKQQQPADVGAGDRVRLHGAYAAAGKTPGTFYYNCNRIEIVQTCFDKDYDVTTRLPGKSLLLVPSLTVEKPPAGAKEGFFSQLIWPTATTKTAKDDTETPFLRLTVRQARWTAKNEKAGARPPLAVMDMTFWESHCEKLLLGHVPLNVWRALMEGGKNPVGFLAICIQEPPTRFSTPGATGNLKVQALRSQLRLFLEQRCPLVSRDFASELLLPIQDTAPVAAAAVDGVINVSAAGQMPPSDLPYEFRVMSDAPNQLQTEEDFQQARDCGDLSVWLVFAVQSDRRQGAESLTKKPRTTVKKTKEEEEEEEVEDQEE